MNIFLSAPASELSRLREWVQGALGYLPPPRPEKVTIVTHDPRYGPRVQDDTLSQIGNADIVIADVGGRNPGVLVELGIAAGLRKPMVLLATDSSEVPSDLRGGQYILAPRDAPESHMAARLAVTIDQVLAKQEGREALSEKGRKAAKGQRTRKLQKVFISYSHSDRDFVDRILVHLRPLERDGLLQLWADTQLRPGDKWKEAIRAAIEEAGVALLVISADFLASDFIATDELPPLLSAAEERGAKIVPVIVKPSRFLRDARLSRFQAANDPANPVIRMNEADREELFAKVAETIELTLGVMDIV